MFGIEEDNKPLLNRIKADAGEKHSLAIKVADLEKQLRDKGIPPDQQQTYVKIQSLTRELAAKELEIDRLKNQPTPLAPVVLSSHDIQTPQQLNAPTQQPYNPLLVYPPHHSNSGGRGWGYRGAGGTIPVNPTTQPGNGSPSNSLGYEPDRIGPVSGGLQYSGANTPHSNPEYVSSISSPEAIDQNMKSKMCPVYKAQGRDVLMTAAKLYKTRVDINENGIWFDKGELQEIVSKLTGSVWTDLAGIVKRWQQPSDQITTQLNRLVEIRKQYDEQYQRYLQLHLIVQSGGPDKDKCIGEYRTLTQDLKVKEGQIKKGIDITPGQTVTIAKSVSPPSGHADLKFCPVERASNQKIIMARVKIFGEPIDASKHGLWFDEGELVRILKKVQTRDTGIIARAKEFLKGEGITTTLEKEVIARIAKVKERDEAHKKLLENQKMQQFGKEYDELEERYNRLSRELDSSVDITPRWLNL